MDWHRPGAVLHTTRLWGSFHLGVGRRAASRAWQRALSNGRHRFTMRETLPWKNTHMGLPEGVSGHTDTQPSTGADRRPGRANTSTPDCSEWSEPSLPGGTTHLEIGTPRRWHPLSSGPTSAWREFSLSADLRGRKRAAQSFWSSGCGPRICAMLLRDTATLRLDLPPPRAVLACSPSEISWRSPTLFMEVSAVRSAAVADRNSLNRLQISQIISGWSQRLKALWRSAHFSCTRLRSKNLMSGCIYRLVYQYARGVAQVCKNH